MVSLTIRNIPEEILRRIRIFAARERRSMNSEMLMVIEEGLSSRIAAEATTGSFAAGALSVGTALSSAGREKVWTELCGEWKDTKSEREALSEVLLLRGNTENRESTR